MAWYSKLFSSVGVNLTNAIGGVLDDLITSDEERRLTDNEKLKIQTAYEIRVQQLLIELDRQQAEHERGLEAELTARLSIDMKSDSWLSKSIRPLTLIFVTSVVSILAFFTVFNDHITDRQLDALKEWIPLFTTIMVTIYAFYFGSRGIEKFQKMKSSGRVEEAKANNSNMSPKG